MLARIPSKLLGYVFSFVYEIPNITLVLLLLLACFPLRRRHLAAQGRCTTVGHEVLLYILATYIVRLLSLTIRYNVWFYIFHGWPVVPPRWFEGWWSFQLWTKPIDAWDWVMLAGNVLLFVPLGLLLPLGWRGWNAKKVALVGALVSLGIETTQLVMGTGAFDLQDVWVNALGVLLGFGLSCLISHRFFVR